MRDKGPKESQQKNKSVLQKLEICPNLTENNFGSQITAKVKDAKQELMDYHD